MTDKRLQYILILLILPLAFIQAQKTNAQYQEYINKYRDLAIEQMMRWKIPASITLAQALLESSAGNSDLAQKGNNHFGIKCHGWTGRKTYHDDDQLRECFRAYDNVRDSYEDHSQFLARQPRYSKLFTLKITDYKRWAHQLKACGYATSNTYAQQLINIIETYRLYHYDTPNTQHTAKQHTNHNHATQTTHTVYYNNRNYYVIAKTGDTFKTIAKEYNLSYRKIARYNERNKKDTLRQGDIIYLEKKQSKAEKKYKKTPHTVKTGESMYTIAQKYGIRLKKLYKKNKLNTKTHKLKVGDKLRLY